jgi:eukaryotic-like serine/threonine-protein kinase
MLHRFYFSCAAGHQWEVELGELFAVDSATNPCPVCGAQGESRALSESVETAGFEDELPPPPSRPMGTTSDGRARAVWAAAAAARDRMSGDPPRIAGYEILGELGRGGMGVVYHAKQVSLGRHVALKIVLAGAHASSNERSRLRVEAETVASMKHPNIVPIHEVGEQDNLPYLAFELVEGGSLAQALAVRPMATEQAAALAETLARAVSYVHERGVVHRDLKPANVLLTVDGVPKITDFGLAKWLDVPSGHTKSGVILGTPGYMAPEQAKGQTSRVGPATDVYALGAILYEMLTGRPPFHAASAQETVQQLLTEDPVPPSRLQRRVSRDLETICLKCLQKEPARRYAGAAALADDLQLFLSGRPIQARPTPSWERAVKWTRRRPAVAALVGFVVIATTALVALGVADNARLQRQRAIANTERDAAKKAQQRAEADFRLALDAVKRFYTEVSENKLLLVPTMDAVRIELLERARDFYDRIARERPDEPNVQAELGRAVWRLAAMVGDSRSVPEGIALMEQAVAVQERLVRRYPGRPEYRSDLGRSFNNLGIMHRSNGQRGLGAEDWKRALTLREQLVREHPNDFLARRDLAQSLHNLGNWHREERGHNREAEDAYRRALAIQSILTREAPDAARRRTDLPLTPFVVDPARIRYDLAYTYYNLGCFYLGASQTDKSAEALQQALEQLDRLVREQPSRASYRHLLSKTYYELGRLEQSNGRIAQATAAWNRARDLLQTLVREHPADSKYPYNLALTLRSLSVASDANGHPAEADETRRSAREVEERLIREHPETTAYYYDAAQIYTSCSTTLVPSAAGSVDRKTFAESCGGLALGMLVEAEKAGYFRGSEGAELLKIDDALNPLRSRDDFHQLLARVAAASASQAK